MDRRAFGVTAASALAALALGSARRAFGTPPAATNDGHLTARPRGGVKTTLASGPLGIGGDRDGVVQMPSDAAAGPLPLVLFLHGASQDGERMLLRIGKAANEAGVVVVAPDSRNGTWDAIRGGFGEDVEYLNRVLEHVFERVNVDTARLTLGGFSDGASYALSLGLANGDLFPRVVACSPGFVVPAPVHGRPRFLLSHGTSDQVLPIDQCSRVIVPNLKSMGYDVTYREFDGRHELPPAIAVLAMEWIASPNGALK